jgi:hypothetical protein
MQKLHFTTTINAPVSHVWDTMLADTTYRQWTEPFSKGSYYQGDWNQGSRILFLGPDPEGSGEGGMVARIAENRLHEYISIEHLGIIKNGIEDTESEEIKQWTPAFENYTFASLGESTTRLDIDIDVHDDYADMFSTMWPSALERLKDLCEHDPITN